MRAHPEVPRITFARRRPFRAVGHAGMLEFIPRQIFRLAFDRYEAAGANDAWNLQVAGDIGSVVPRVEFILHMRGDRDPAHLKKSRRLLGELSWVYFGWKDLPVNVQQEMSPNVARRNAGPALRRLVAELVEEGCGAQDVVVLQFIHRQI